MNLEGCFSHNTDDWRTPSNIYNFFMDAGYRDLFPFKADFDQYQIFYDNEKLFINPPYSQLKRVASYVRDLYFRNNRIALLIPARTDTSYFHDLLRLNPAIFFIPGRLHFNDSVQGAPFPSIIMYFDLGRQFPQYGIFNLR